jgi:signal transduction histidine kinase
VLGDVVSSQLLEAGQVAQVNSVALVRELGEGVVVKVPAALLHTIVQNLVSNALKYSAGRDGARVTVRVSSEASCGVLEVEDNGPGISREAQSKLFQPFFRAKETQGLAGHGLGLATVKRVVEAHGGAITLDSEPGKGTKVVVRVPRASPEGVLGLAAVVSGR